MSSIPLNEWIENYKQGEYNAPDFSTQCEAGWYDWFCSEHSLAGKTKKLAPKVLRIAKSSKINLATMYVWFKNNCPLQGKLYDDFRFADLKTGDTQYTIVPSSGFDAHKGQAEVWGRENSFAAPLVTGTWKDVLTFFGV